MNVFHVLVCNLYNGNIINIHFVFLNQVKQKVQRSFKHLQFYRDSHIVLPLPAFYR